ncbi:MAG TPA: hypothetical protein VG318_10560 [Actinomycetota bacterium]|nr:hypothetical protein [Actinomycetota bacterium]
MRSQRPPSPWQFVAGAAACCVLGWFAFVRGTNVPVLSLADLGFHELGHLLTYVFPDVVTAMMGSVTQVAVPWGLAAYFFVGRRDVFGGVFCLAWAGTSAQNASVYIADAPWESLQLIGGYHDWAFVLGPEHLDVLHRAADIAAVVRGGGLVMLLNALVISLAGAALSLRQPLPAAPHRPNLRPWGPQEHADTAP